MNSLAPNNGYSPSTRQGGNIWKAPAMRHSIISTPSLHIGKSSPPQLPSFRSCLTTCMPAEDIQRQSQQLPTQYALPNVCHRFTQPKGESQQDNTPNQRGSSYISKPPLASVQAQKSLLRNCVETSTDSFTIRKLKSFACDQCTRSFDRHHDLKRHKRLHPGVKPHECSFCNKTFSRQDALKVRQ